jgi:hypothetical protein
MADEIKGAPEILWTACIQCKGDTRHDLVHEVLIQTDPGDDDGPPFTVLEKFQMVSCRGCERHSFRYGWAIAEEGYDWVWESYPQNPKDRKAVQIFILPKQVRKLYHETLRAYNAKAITLASAGIRASVEAICQERGFVKGSLKEKIDEMCNAGILPKDNAEFLHQHRFLGNEAIHDMVTPPEDEFLLALEIMEHLMQSLYQLPRRAKQLMELRAARGAQVQ